MAAEETTVKTRLLALIACALCALPALAQDYPTKTINIIVPLSAGGGTDLLARVLAVKLREKFGQPVVQGCARRAHAVVHPAGAFGGEQGAVRQARF